MPLVQLRIVFVVLRLLCKAQIGGKLLYALKPLLRVVFFTVYRLVARKYLLCVGGRYIFGERVLYLKQTVKEKVGIAANLAPLCDVLARLCVVSADFKDFFGAGAVGGQQSVQLWVKVKKDWRDSDFMIKNFGYDKKEI